MHASVTLNLEMTVELCNKLKVYEAVATILLPLYFINIYLHLFPEVIS